MSIIDRALQELQTPASAQAITLTIPEAFAAVMVAAISADGRFGVDEANRLNHVLSTSKVFEASVRVQDVDVVQRALNLLADRGVAPVLDACGAALPPELRPTVFAVAADLVLADGRVDAREKSFVDQLQAALRVDDATALKIVEVLLIKNRG
jgi:hypothetical protein